MLPTILIVLVVLIAIVALFYWLRRRKDYGTRICRLPLDELGYPNMPAVPFELRAIPGTLLKLSKRANAITQALWGMSNEYTIGNETANGYSFLYGRLKDTLAEKEQERQTLKADLEKTALEIELTVTKTRSRLHCYEEPEEPPPDEKNDITLLALTDPGQFAMSWTTFNGVYNAALPHLQTYKDSLTEVAVANREFWPAIANHGFAYNLLILEKVDAPRASDYKAALGDERSDDVQQLLTDNLLYAIDLRWFDKLPVSTVKGNPRFTPGTLTLLAQDPKDKSLSPVVVLVSGQGKKQVYSFARNNPNTWLYALLAAKTSVTLYGIWLGHVYHWHIVSAALLMTLNNEVEVNHPLRVFMAPQSDYLIPFNDVLLLLWKNVAPPTSVSTASQFLALTDSFAKGRSFLEDDPDVTLLRNGIKQSDFTISKPWDQYPIAGKLLSVFAAAGDYVSVFVNNTWTSDAAVVADKQLQAWFAASSDPQDGNVAGLPTLDGRDHLIATLKSLVFRLTAHGASRLNSTANPVLSFVPNFPPCLQIKDIPPREQPISTPELLEYLPRTGTIGEMVTFLFTFVFSAPYVPFLPLAGNETELLWGPDPNEPRNAALIKFRDFMEEFIKDYSSPAQLYQWPRNIET